MLDDDEIEGGLAHVRLEGPRHDHQKLVVKARLFGGEAPQRRIGRFLVRGELGRGGMGTVLEAYDEQLDRAVAIKLVEDGLRAKHQDRLLREAQALAKLSHPNVVGVHEVGIVDGRVFIVMELIRGITLDRWQRKPRPWRDLVDVYRQAGLGLAAAHAAGLVHRDFKPSNCIIDDDGRVRVLDFGLARELDDDEDGCDRAVTHDSDSVVASPTEPGVGASGSSGGSESTRPRRLTGTGALLGTRAYMAPEQLHWRIADARSDQFGFCVALYEALYGQPPFSDDPEPVLLAMAKGISRSPSPPPRGSKVPQWLRRSLWRGLSARPDDRWPSMDALLHALDHRQRRARVQRASWVSGGVFSLALASVVALALPPAPACRDAVRGLDGIWDDAQRKRVGNAMLATGHPRAEHTWSFVRRELDRYAADWVEISAQACEATILRREQPLEALDLRQRCLRQRRIALRHHVDLLASGDPRRVDDADGLVTGLPPIEHCMDIEALAREVGDLPFEVEREAELLREELGRIRALDLVGQREDGLAAVEPLLGRANELGHPLLLAEVLHLTGQLHMNAGAHEKAEELFKSAWYTALAHDAASESAIKALASSIYLIGVMREKTESALLLGSMAEALAARPGLDPSLRTEVLTAVAQVLTLRGELSEAQRRYRQAVEILEEHRGADHIALVEALDGWGTAAHWQGDRDRAKALYRRALAIREQWLGPDHPAVAYLLANLAAVLIDDRDRRLEALEHVERAVRILDGARRPDHERFAHARTNLGAILSELDRHADAEEQLRGAVEQWSLAGQTSHLNMAKARMNLASVLKQQGRVSDALEQYRLAQHILEVNEPTPALDELKAKVRKRIERLLPDGGAAAPSGPEP